MSAREHHQPCPCGRELDDECMCSRGNPLGSMRIVPPVGSRVPAGPSTGRATLGERSLGDPRPVGTPTTTTEEEKP